MAEVPKMLQIYLILSENGAKEAPLFVFIDEADAALARQTENNDHRDGNRALTEFLKGLIPLDSTGFLSSLQPTALIFSILQ